VAQTSYPSDYVLPWEHISTGASRRWLVRERRRAERGTTTPDCTFGPCSACGVCALPLQENELASPRVSGEAGEDAVADACERATGGFASAEPASDVAVSADSSSSTAPEGGVR
jgi:hypothetical protein